MSRYVDIEGDWVDDAVKAYSLGYYDDDEYAIPFEALGSAPSIDIVRCKECKHRPIKEDPDEADYGFNLIEPNDGDERCPCLVSDGWYSWMPKDDFYCGFGEREDE